jgi:uncharacterized RDD family membrane protein YckC
LRVTDEASAADYASWWSRVGASVVDSIVVVVGAAVTIAIAFGIGALLGSVVRVILTFGGLLLWAIGYFVYFEGGEEGQTLGKRALSIRVRSVSGGRASYGQAVGRRLVAVVFNVLSPIGLIDVLWPLWDERRQCLHDKAASTVVERAR